MLATLLLCVVTAIHDGDVLMARCGEPGFHQDITVRLNGIDAPERSQPYGNEARLALVELCWRKTAKVQPRSLDRFNRIVADVECRGVDAAREQVRSGMAWASWEYGVADETLLPLQSHARMFHQGLWRDGGLAVPPWEWRRSRRWF